MKALMICLALLIGRVASAADIIVTFNAGTVLADKSNAPTAFTMLRRTGSTPYNTLQEITWVDGTTAYTITDATTQPGIKYCYQTFAHNSAGNSPTSNEACAVARDGASVAVDIPTANTSLVSRRATNLGIVSFLVDQNAVVAVNDSLAAVNATVTINTAPGALVLISRRATNLGITSSLVDKDQVLYINGTAK